MTIAESRPSRRQHKSIDVSFEFFPPKTAEMEKALWESIERLAPLRPKFVSVTYGAGGSTRERTHATVARIVRETQIKPAAHLTCVGATRDEVDEVARGYWAAGVRHIVALRGDPQGGLGTAYAPTPGGYAHSTDLVRGLRAIGDFEISVSAYPEKHPESASFDQDIDVLKAKIDAGATRAITQFFFENDLYFRFLDRVLAAGNHHPHRARRDGGAEFQADGEFREKDRGERAELAGRAFRRARRRSANPPPDRGGGGGGTSL